MGQKRSAPCGSEKLRVVPLGRGGGGVVWGGEGGRWGGGGGGGGGVGGRGGGGWGGGGWVGVGGVGGWGGGGGGGGFPSRKLPVWEFNRKECAGGHGWGRKNSVLNNGSGGKCT